MSQKKSLSAGQKGLNAKERQEMGFTDRLNGLSPQYSNDGYYMKGYHSDNIKQKQLDSFNNQIAAAEAIAIELGIAV